jgi:ACS family pantothenate transporter-like MFS transporter
MQETILTNEVRPSYYLPTAELLWSIVTFCFAAVQKVEHVFALRFIVGFLESPFAVGVITLMGSWYTPRGKSSPCYTPSLVYLSYNTLKQQC